MIKQRGRGFDLVCAGIHQKTKISEMPVCVGDHGIEYEHVRKRVRIFLPETFVVVEHRKHPAAGHDIPDRHEGSFLAREQLTLRTDVSFPFGDGIRYGGQSHRFCDLPGIKLGIRLVSGIGRTIRPSLVEMDSTILSSPAFREHAVGREFRT